MKTHASPPLDGGDELGDSQENTKADDAPEAEPKKAMLQRKCTELQDSVGSMRDLYEGILSALAHANQESLVSLQGELTRLRDAIGSLEKKSIKRMKLVGTLAAIEKQSHAVRLKARMLRRKDLNRIDDFVLDSFRALRALNQKLETH